MFQGLVNALLHLVHRWGIELKRDGRMADVGSIDRLYLFSILCACEPDPWWHGVF
jgi:hypothetical protein